MYISLHKYPWGYLTQNLDKTILSTQRLVTAPEMTFRGPTQAQNMLSIQDVQDAAHHVMQCTDMHVMRMHVLFTVVDHRGVVTTSSRPPSGRKSRAIKWVGGNLGPSRE